jgi:hypothetical protein
MNSQEFFGANMDVGGDVVQVIRCCHNSFWLRTYRTFMHVTGTGSPKYFWHTGGVPERLNLPGNAHRWQRDVRSRGQHFVEFSFVNITGSETPQDGRSFYVQRRGPSHHIERPLCVL